MVTLGSVVPIRAFSSSAVLCGKKNIRKFPLFNFAGTDEFRKRQKEDPNFPIPLHKYGARDTGKMVNGKFEEIPEMIPEIIVPDLTDCKFKPYVSYKAEDVYQTEFTARDLFDAVYSQKVADDFKKGNLNESGDSLNPSSAEKLTPKEAVKLARQTGSDIFG